VESVIDSEDSYKLTNADLNSFDSNLSSDLPEAGKTDTDTEDENWNLSNRLQKQSIKTKTLDLVFLCIRMESGTFSSLLSSSS
jgi:hypothetical protein